MENTSVFGLNKTLTFLIYSKQNFFIGKITRKHTILK